MMLYHKITRLSNTWGKKEFSNSEEHMMGRLDAFVCNYRAATEQNALESWDRFPFHDWLIKLSQADLILEQSRSVMKFALEKDQANIIIKGYGCILRKTSRLPALRRLQVYLLTSESY